MSAASITRRFGRVRRFHLLGRLGFVSDDTEQAALVAQSLARHPGDDDACVRAFRRALLGWFLRLPWGVGLATLRASLRIAFGFRRSGIRSAGNGAAMRAGVVGVYLHDDPERRARLGRALAEVTHTDPRAVAGARFVADVAAACALPGATPASCVAQARAAIDEAEVAAAVTRAVEAAASGLSHVAAGRHLGSTGFVIHTVALATFGFLRSGDSVLDALSDTIGAGGDTDTIAAILGCWLGTLHGPEALPADLVAQINDGPFGPTHLRALATALAAARAGEPLTVPRYSPAAAMARNLALYPVVLGHGFRRLIPF